jgi:hypothetical protein
LIDAVKAALSERFAELRARKAPGDDVAQGRAWVEAYVDYVHAVVRVYQAVAPRAPQHAHGAAAHAGHHAD